MSRFFCSLSLSLKIQSNLKNQIRFRYRRMRNGQWWLFGQLRERGQQLPVHLPGGLRHRAGRQDVRGHRRVPVERLVLHGRRVLLKRHRLVSVHLSDRLSQAEQLLYRYLRAKRKEDRNNAFVLLFQISTSAQRIRAGTAIA